MPVQHEFVRTPFTGRKHSKKDLDVVAGVTSSMSWEKEWAILQSMPPEAAWLMIAYLMFVPKTLAMLTLYLSLDGEDFQFSAGYENHLFNGLHRSWDSDDVSNILVAYTSRPVSEGGLSSQEVALPTGTATVRPLPHK
ncbi:hypothetical protein EV702DRAFT_1193503 [Suillus placidus]|uniref:Uncharacterized protein n=1 Tax=Suillus placidus TaxID=48579 RepID=A0A9P7D6Z3_9AGAM|nr:hypothetical protein EV702DRAFT_1193503 [Suillus placidus]